MPEDRVQQFRTAVDRFAATFKRNLLADLQNKLEAGGLAALITQERFINGLRKDIETYLNGRGRQVSEKRLSSVAVRSIATALTGPQLADCWNVLAASTRRRLQQAEWTQDSEQFRVAIAELVNKQLRESVDFHLNTLRDQLCTLGELLITLDRYERKGQ